MDNVNLNKDIDYFLNLDYDQLVKYLLTAPTEEKKLIIKNQEIKRKLICPENRHEFSWLAQKNVSKPNDMDDRLPFPKPFAIYCYDEIGPNDIESAKNLGIGIVVVNTKKYNIETNNSQISMFDTMSSGRYNNDLKYVNNKSQAVLVESQANRK